MVFTGSGISGTERRARPVIPFASRIYFDFAAQRQPFRWWPSPSRVLAGVLACAFLLVVPAFAQGAENLTPQLADTPDIAHAKYDGVQHLHLRTARSISGRGRTTSSSAGQVPKPEVDGCIVGISPNLSHRRRHRARASTSSTCTTASGSTSARHGRRPARLPERFFAAGEEKTIFQLPQGYGYAYKAADKWLINYMIHNLTPTPDQVWITYDIDFIPATAPAAQGIRPVAPDLDGRAERRDLPGVRRAAGRRRRTASTPTPTGRRQPVRTARQTNLWTVDRDGVLVGDRRPPAPGRPARRPVTAPGAAARRRARPLQHAARKRCGARPLGRRRHRAPLPVDGRLLRAGRRGLVGRGDDRHAARTGACRSTRATCCGSPPPTTPSGRRGTSRWGSWSSGWPTAAGGADPFVNKVDWPGQLTHGHLPENDNHGGEHDGLPDPTAARRRPGRPAPTDGQRSTTSSYSPGDLSVPGPTARRRVSRASRSTFTNSDDEPRTSGTRSPPARRRVTGRPASPTRSPTAPVRLRLRRARRHRRRRPRTARRTWTTPANLPAGTYTYFCRIHPFMRGSFRVVS